jgi:hypothetical protein
VRFSVGYQLAPPDEPSFVDLVEEFRPHIAEVYLPWLAAASGRSPIGGRDGAPEAWAEPRYAEDLVRLKRLGVDLNLLFNANCYGGAALSRALEREVVEVIEDITALAGSVDSLTTTSPAVAHMVKAHFPSLPVRASVNMRIGTVEGMAYLGHLFDEYCVQRDVNRDLGHLAELDGWARANGKRLSILVNSGCFRNCSGQIFHDNLVAHETAVARRENIDGFLPYTCWNYLKDRRHWPTVLQATWVRPEDLHHYDGLFEAVKLATRMHERPHLVIRAYASRSFAGNLLDLFEPGFSPAFVPFIIDNRRFPPDWFERASACSRNCHGCGYCGQVLDEVLVDLSRPAAVARSRRRRAARDGRGSASGPDAPRRDRQRRR